MKLKKTCKGWLSPAGGGAGGGLEGQHNGQLLSEFSSEDEMLQSMNGEK